MAPLRDMVNIPLERDKPVPLTRQIQAHLERLIARWTAWRPA